MKSKNKQQDDDPDVLPFSRVTTVATGWVLDFLFVSLCCHFKEGNVEAFSETLSSFESISKSASLKGDIFDKKFLISAMLARVMHAKQLDVVFEKDDKVMPLMSAAKVWSQLKGTASDDYENIMTLLIVQSVAVCLTNGEKSSAKSALEWFENGSYFPKNLRVKLTTVVKKADAYHPLLQSFSFNRMMEAVQSFVDSYLRRDPCDFIITEATKMVQQSRPTEGSGETSTHDSEAKDLENGDAELPEQTSRTADTTTVVKGKRTLSSKTQELWNPASAKKLHIRLSRVPAAVLIQKLKSSSTEKRRKPQKWTWEQDQKLKNGVKRFGAGKWARILTEYKFSGRTSVMLKDRWRVLAKNQ